MAELKPENSSSADIVIAVMGPTGAGMSTFINVAIRQESVIVGHKLQSCTSEVQAFRCLFSDDVARFVFVDTPGFDESNKTDEEILTMITQWLKTSYSKNFRLAGIIYLHRISDNRRVIDGSPLKNIRRFKELCGDNAIGKVILVTTMWDRVTEDVGSLREAELKEKYWRGMLTAGSQVKRFHCTFESAWDVVSAIAKMGQLPSLHPRESPAGSVHTKNTISWGHPNSDIGVNPSVSKDLCDSPPMLDLAFIEPLHTGYVASMDNHSSPEGHSQPRNSSYTKVSSKSTQISPSPTDLEEPECALELVIPSSSRNGQTQDASDFSVGKQGGLASALIADIVKGAETISRRAQDSVRKFWKYSRNGTSVSSDELSNNEVIIAVVGPTGAGKSSFIKMATGYDICIGHGLQLCTSEIELARVHFTEKSDLDVVFVDTPGFDDGYKGSAEILEMMTQRLETIYRRQIKLAGLLYFHRISDNRITAAPLKDLDMFKKLCGRDGLQNLILTTTMWDEVDEDEGIQRERELRRGSWKVMAIQGSTIARYWNTMESAWEIVEPFLRDTNNQSATRLQYEMVEMKRRVSETQVGGELYGKLEILFREQQETLQRIRAESIRLQGNRPCGDLKAEYEELRKKLEVTIADIQTMKLPVGQQLVRTALSPLGLIKMDGWVGQSFVRV